MQCKKKKIKMLVTGFNRFKNIHVFSTSIVWEIFCEIVDTNEVEDMLPHKDYEYLEYFIFYNNKK